MKITDLYKKNRSIPWITLAVVLCCIAVTTFAVVRPEMYKNLAWSKYPQYIWQYCSGAFLHGTGDSASMAIMHLSANLLMFVPYAVFIEKMVGHKKFGIIFLLSWLGVSAAFQIYAWLFVPAGEAAYGAGLSGSSYAVITVGAFILFKLFLKDKKGFFRQPLAYIFVSGLVAELFMLMPIVAGIASTLIHVLGIIIGVITILIFKNAICAAIE